MYKLRKKQIQILIQKKTDNFKHRLIDYLIIVLENNGNVISFDRLSNIVDEGVKHSKYYRLNRECDLARFIEIICVNFGSIKDLVQNKEVLEILYDHRVSPDEKLNRLEKYAKKFKVSQTPNIVRYR